MAVNSVKVVINGVTHTLTLNSSTGKYEATITAPTKSSYNQSNHYYPVTVTATDNAGNSTTKDVSDSVLGASLQLRVLEKVKPVQAITSPSSGSVLINNKPTFEWTITDDDSGVDPSTIKIKIDSTTISDGITKTAITGGYRCTYTPTAALKDGSHTYTVSASDYDGNAADTKSATFTIDTVAPTLNVTTPADGYITNKSTVTVAGTTNDATTSPVTLKINGTTVNVGSDGSFSHTVSLSEGANIITIVATDGAGKSTTVTRNVMMNTNAPVISAVTITPNPVDAGATYVISVTVTDE
jgi:hypothetical protein